MAETTPSEAELHEGNAGLLAEPIAFGPFTLVRRLGHGGGATVFLAARTAPRGEVELVVIKRLHEHLNEDAASRAAFLDEARLMSRLMHPGVARILSAGDADGRAYFAMEYLEGRDLSRVVARAEALGERVPAPVAARIVADALDALHYAHELADERGAPMHIVHRDVSPQNLFVTAEGNVKLLDFGIAKTRLRSTSTSTGVVKGKFAYIAPEQARGLAVDRRADLWSMGVVLWELVVGERLFAATNEFATLAGATVGPVPRLADTLPGVAPELDVIAAKALAREPATRYASAAAMRADLLAYLETHPASSDDVRAFFTRLFGAGPDEAQRLRERFVTPGLTPQPSRANTPPNSVERTHRARRFLPLFAACVAVGVTLFVARRPGQETAPVERPRVDAAPAPAPRVPPAPEVPSAVVEPAPAPAAPPPDEVAPQTAQHPGARIPATPPTQRDAGATDAAAVLAVAMAPEPGTLDLVTVPWSNVTIAGRDLGTTPVLGHALPPGTYDVVFENSELALRRSVRVVVHSGEVTRVRLRLAD